MEKIAQPLVVKPTVPTNQTIKSNRRPLNNSTKSLSFAYAGAVALVVIVIGALLQPAGQRSHQPAPAATKELDAEPIWRADSVAAEPKLQVEPAVKVTPVPPLPQETFKFRSLPPSDEGEAPTFTPLPPRDEGAAPTFAPLPKLQEAKPDDRGGVQIRNLPTLPPASHAGASPSSQEKESAIDLGQLIHRPAIKPAMQSAVNLRFAAPAIEQPLADGNSKVQPEFSRTLDGMVVKRLPKPAKNRHSQNELGQNEFAQNEFAQNEFAQNEFAQNKLPTQSSEPHQSLASADLEVSQFGFVEPLLQKGDFQIKLVSAQLPADSPAKKKKKKKKVVVSAKKGGASKSALAKSAKSDKESFKLAAQPEIGDHYVEDNPQTDTRAHLIEPLASDFSPDPLNPHLPYDPFPQMNVYQGKTLNANQRPLVELGRPWYQLGQLSPGSSILGFHNNVNPQFLIYGDHRTGYASNRQNGDSTSQIATQLNLDFDLKLTGTERLHAAFQPINATRFLGDDESSFEGSANPLFGYLEGDLGAIVGGAINKTLPFDLPFAIGEIPLLFQNGVWLEDAILGVAVTIPARNSPRFDISNMDITFFAGYDKVDSDAFPGDDSAARIIGIATFLEMLNGYIEIDYAFLDDRTFADRSYHNIGIGYTRRYGRFLSNSTRVIVNAGQNAAANGENTADGVLFLSENSLITGAPSNVVPYFNMFAGFDRPQSAARAAGSGGVLRNTGILFESDNLTGYPTLDATANDTFGMSLGVNILSGGDSFTQQLVLETSLLGVMGDDATRNAKGDQYGVGFRYQLPLSNSVIFRTDGMFGFLRNDDDISGIRVEVRKKF